MSSLVEISPVNAHEDVQEYRTEKAVLKAGSLTTMFRSIFMTILITLFPKCPLCWAVYMGMLGTLKLATLPYMPWLLPVLLMFLGFNLVTLFAKSLQNGYIPFALSVAGAVLVLSGRFFFPLQEWLLLSGMALIVSGSLLNGFFNTLPPLTRVKERD